uniref:Uncharacterized protein n=1 Tax=Oryza meridionalis TaxID=40149 RepID=A0A0E0EUI9_9ORYZ
MGMAPGSSTASSRFAESATPPMLSWWWSQWASPLGTGAVMASLRPSPSRRLYPHRVSELTTACSTSSEGFLLSKHITYSITAASQGSVIFSSPVNPNSSSDNLRSSPNTVVLRYVNGTPNRSPSAV